MLFSSFVDDGKVKRFLTITAVFFIVMAVLTGQVYARSLGEAQIRVLGISVSVDTRPDIDGLQDTMTGVKDVPCAVTTVVGVPGVDLEPNLPVNYIVKAEISGPDFGDGAQTVTGLVNGLIELPVFRNPGEYLLTNVRLEDGQDNVILERDSSLSTIVITVIDELLVTQVTSRPLSLDEIEELGIVIDEDNFSVMNFTIGLTLGSEPVTIEMPVAIPNSYSEMDAPAITLPSATQRDFDQIEIPNFQIVGFQMQAPDLPDEVEIELPAINGVIVIPGNIAFLNQFFSVFLQATNTAPEDSGLVFQNALATIELPSGEDGMIGTGDDPLRVAEQEGGVINEVLPLNDNDGNDSIIPQGTNQAEFLVEGLREGAHVVRFDVTGDLFIPSLGETIPMTGQAAGIVQVNNPTFKLVLAHPEVVRAGEEYSIIATVTNTSSSWANLFQIALNTRSLSGCRMADGETETKTVDTIGPGQAEAFEFRLVAQTTGKVTGMVFLADEGINGNFMLTVGVGDNNIPLSPDTIILPSTVQFLPDNPDLTFAATRVLGLAYSVATAPAGSLPEGVSRVSKSFVFDRAAKLAQAGLHVRFGEDQVVASQDILMDYLGSAMTRVDALYPDQGDADLVRDDLKAFDSLRRTTDAGLDFAQALAAIIGLNLGTQTLAEIQMQWAETFISTAPHFSFGSSGTGALAVLHAVDAQGRELGFSEPGADILREIPFGERYTLSDHEDMLVIATPESTSYDFEFIISDLSTNISLVVPDGNGMVQALYDTASLGSGAFGRISWSSVLTNTLICQIDADNDGVFEQTITPAITPVIDNPPTVLGVHQWGKGSEPMANSFEVGDALGLLIGVLFDEEVTALSAKDSINYSLPGIGVSNISFQPDRRMVFCSLNKPVGPFIERTLSVENIEDLAANISQAQDIIITPDPELGDGGTFTGRVLTAEGLAVSFATFRYIQPVLIYDDILQVYVPTDVCVSSFTTGYDGSFSLDFVLVNTLKDSGSGQKLTKFRLEAVDPQSGMDTSAESRIAFNGQNMSFNLIIRGFGSIEGIVYDESGIPVVGGDPGTPECLAIKATNISTGEVYTSWVDANGFYSFPREFEQVDQTIVEASGVAAGNVTLSVVRPSDQATAVATVNIAGSGALVVRDLILITSSGTVAGQILEADGITGAPYIYVQIKGRVLNTDYFFSNAESFSVVGSATTDENGYFDFGSIPSGNIEILAFRQSTYEQTRATNYLGFGEDKFLTLILPGSGATVRGYVKDAAGYIVENADVSCGLSLTKTDENGFFEFPGLPLGNITIVAKGPDSQTTSSVSVVTYSPDEIQEVIIFLQSEGSITGTIYEADTTTTVSGQKVQLWIGTNDDGMVGTTVTDENGVYTFSGYPVGDYTVRAVTADYGDGGMASTTIRFQDDVVDADIIFRGLYQIKGRVLAESTPVISDIIITRKVWKIIPSQNWENNYYLDYVEQLSQSDNEDVAASVQAAMASENFSLEPPEFFMLASEPVLLSSNILEPDGTVTGRFEYTGSVTAGPFKVAAYGPFLSPTEVSGDIPRSTVNTMIDVGDIILLPSTGEVEGIVYMPDNQTRVGEGVQVIIQCLGNSGDPQGLPEYTVNTDENGYFYFPLVLKGRFELTADTGEPPIGVTPATSAAQMQTEIYENELNERQLNVRLYGNTSGVVPNGGLLVADVRLLDVAGIDVHVFNNDETPVDHPISVQITGLDNANTDSVGFVDFFPMQEGIFSITATDPDTGVAGVSSGEVPVNPANGHVVSVNVILGAVTTSSGEVVDTEFYGTVTGTIYRADGTALTNPAEITVQTSGIDILATSDEFGGYTVNSVPKGFFVVSVLEPLTARTGSANGAIQSDGQVVEIDITLLGLGIVTGQVLSYDGTPVTSTVDISLTPSGSFTQPLISRVDAQGFYSLPGVPLGQYAITAVDAASMLTGEAFGELLNDGDTATTDVILEACGTITGTVYAAGVFLDENGLPVDEFGVPLDPAPVEANAFVTMTGPGFSQTIQADGNGDFSFGSFLSMGTYSLEAVPASGNDGTNASATLSDGGEVLFVPMALNGHGIINGMVVDSIGAPVTSCLVTLECASPFAVMPVDHITDANGEFVFTNVFIGEFSLTANHIINSVELGGSAVAVLEGHGQTIDFFDNDADIDHNAIRLEDVGSVTGQVFLDDGLTPAEGAVILLSGDNFTVVRQADANGDFLFINVPLGSYSVSISDPSTNGIASDSLEIIANGDVIDLGQLVIDSNYPSVAFVQPGADSVGVSPLDFIVITFTELIDPSSVTPTTFQVLIEGTPVPGFLDVSLSEPVVTFIPDEPLPDLKHVNIIISGDKFDLEGELVEFGITDLSGLGMRSDYIFGFTTSDITPPEFVSLSPYDGETGVDVSSVIRVEFSESVDPGSIISFTLETGGVSVFCSMNDQPIFDNTVFVFTIDPGNYLYTDLDYTATLTGNIADSSGNANTQSVIEWSFSTTDTQAPDTNEITLSNPGGDSLIFGKTINFLTDIGSITDADFVDFFIDDQLVYSDLTQPFEYSLYLDPQLGQNPTLSTVVVDLGGNRSQQILLPLIIAVNQPPGVTIISPQDGIVGLGETIVLRIEATDDVALTQIAYTANNGIVDSSTQNYNPAHAYLDQTSYLQCTIPADYPVGTTIELVATATDSFDQVAQSAPVILTVEDLLAPQVSIGSPAHQSYVGAGDQVNVFVMAEDGSKISQISLSVSDAATYSETRLIAPAVSPASQSFSFIVDSNAVPTQNVDIIATAIDAAGNSNTHVISLNLTDVIAPTASLSGALEVEPGAQAYVQVTADDEIGVAKVQVNVPQIFTETRDIAPQTNTTQDFNFTVPSGMALGSQITVYATVWDTSDNMVTCDPIILTTADLSDPSVTITSPGAGTLVIPGESFSIEVTATDTYGVASVSYQATGAAFGSDQVDVDPPVTSTQEIFTLAVPSGATAGSLITIQASAVDSAGNSGQAALVSVIVADIISPVVNNITPNNGETDVDPDTLVQVVFSEQIATGTITSSTMILTGPDGAVQGAYSFLNSDTTVQFDPDQSLTLGGVYTITLTTDITDLAGNGLESDVTSIFTIDNTPPYVENITPNSEEQDASIHTNITITFSEPMGPATVTTNTIILRTTGEGAALVDGSVTLNGSDVIAVFNPSEDLANDTTYELEVTTGVADVAGNFMVVPYISHFTTTSPDIESPYVVEHRPDVITTTIRPDIVIVFNEPIDMGTVTSQTFEVECDGEGCVVPTGTYTSSHGGTWVIWSPDNDLELDTTYSVELDQIRDLYGNIMSSSYDFDFLITNFALIAPENGDRVIEGQVVEFTADNFPNIYKDRVEFFVNGSYVGESDDEPWTDDCTIPAITGGNAISAVLQAEAFGDFNGIWTSCLSDEVIITIYPGSGDVDGDGMSNEDELGAGTDPFNDDADLDPDSDNLTNIEEVNIYGTDPLKADTDEDGLDDGVEITLGTDPLDSDTDDDGMPDGYENDHGLAPLIDDADLDLDNDTIANIDEFLLGSDPQVVNGSLDTTGQAQVVLNGHNVFTSVFIDEATTIISNSDEPMGIVSAGSIEIAGIVDVSGSDGSNGVLGATQGASGGFGIAGGADGGDGGYQSAGADGCGLGFGYGALAGTQSYGNGGGGAGYAEPGENGSEYICEGCGGNGGISYGNQKIDPVLAGSGGGGGSGFASGNGGAGGSGGGAVYIQALGSLIIESTGEIFADGGDGGVGANEEGGGIGGSGGGGSGGAIILQASGISNYGSVHADGGLGGSPATEGACSGGDGALGRILMDCGDSEQKLVISDAGAGDFGQAVCVSGDQAIFGSLDDASGTAKAVFVYERSGDTWTRSAVLQSDDGDLNDAFGDSVSISGSWAIVGAPDDYTTGSNAGSAYIFQKTEGSWSQALKLIPDSGSSYTYFGTSVSISGHTAIVGESRFSGGKVYVYQYDGENWIAAAQLLPSDSTNYFGESVAVSGEYVVVGAYGDDYDGTNSGAAYVFKREADSWSQVAKLKADDASSYDYFGKSVSISNDKIIVGAFGKDVFGSQSGAAYIFQLMGSAWTQVSSITPDSGASYEYFGMSVSISGNYAVAGCTGAYTDSIQTGSAYLFKLDSGIWNQSKKLLASDGGSGDEFGKAVSVSGGYVFAGAPYDADGSVWAYYVVCGDSPDTVDQDGDGYSLVQGDCNDSDPSINPGMVELCDDSVDQNCDGTPLCPANIDDDGDSFTENQGDCDDANDSVYPGATEICGDGIDQDCDGADLACAQNDEDGDGFTINQGDCDDIDSTVFPGAVEICGDGIDQDCDGLDVTCPGDCDPGVTEAKLVPATAVAWDWFGESAAISGDYAIVGESYAYIDGIGYQAGTAHIFERDGLSWNRVLSVQSDSPQAYSRFGVSVSIKGDYAIAGHFGEDSLAADSGAAIVYKREEGTWIKSTTLKADDYQAYDQFGYSVAQSENRAIIGAWFEDGAAFDAGAAYIFDRSGDVWTQAAKLLPAPAGNYDWFGGDVGLSGDTAIVGAPHSDRDESNNPKGAAYIFTRHPDNSWTLNTALTPASLDYGDNFGKKVAVSGLYAVVSAEGDDDIGADSGAVYVYKKGEGTWNQLTKLTAPDAAAGDFFGNSVAIYGDYIAVGAYLEDGDGIVDSGSVYIFERSGDVWNYKLKINAGNAAAYDKLGFNDVAMDNGFIIAGAVGVSQYASQSGAAYVYHLSCADLGDNVDDDGDLYSENDGDCDDTDDSIYPGATEICGDGIDQDCDGSDLLCPEDIDDDGDNFTENQGDCDDADDSIYPGATEICGDGIDQDCDGSDLICEEACADTQATQYKVALDYGMDYDLFGATTAISGNTAVIGAPGQNSDTGMAYVYGLAESWSQTTSFSAGEGAIAGDLFGCSVSLSGNNALIGAKGDGYNGILAGAAYLFQNGGEGWGSPQKLLASDGDAGHLFGSSVSISDSYALIGASEKDIAQGEGTLSKAGCAYIWSSGEGSWSQSGILEAQDGATDKLLGYSVHIDGSTAVVGAPGDSTNGTDSGAIYVFANGEGGWSQTAKITPDDGQADDGFATSVFVSGNRIIVGAPYVSVTVGEGEGAITYNDLGAVYVFEHGEGWSQTARLIADPMSDDAMLGMSVSMSADYIVAGASGEDTAGVDAGNVYLFGYDGEAWNQVGRLLDNNAAANDDFGGTVSISGDKIVVGAKGVDSESGGEGEPTPVSDSGAAFFFDLICTP